MNDNNFKQTITKTQELNKDKMNQTHQTFYKRYKSRPRTTKPLFPFFSNNTAYNQQNSTLLPFSKHNDSPPKKFFGLDGKASLNFNTTTKSVFDNTQMKTVSNIQMRTISQYVEEDELNLHQIFSTISKGNKYQDKDGKDYLYNKYNIEKGISEIERKEIKQIMRPITSAPFEHNSKTIELNVKNDNYSFHNPFKSYKAMKQNMQLAKRIEDMRNSKLCQLFQEEFDKVESIRMKKARMPPVKVTPKQKQNEIIESLKQKYQSIFYAQANANLTSNIAFPMHEKLSRDELFNNVTIDVNYKLSNYHPPSRTQFGSVFFKTLLGVRLYVFGGMGGMRLNDLWECTFEKGRVVWKKIEFPREKKPWARYGHTIHLDEKNILYIVGGIQQEIEGEEYINSNDIMTMFDLNKRKFISIRESAHNHKVTPRRNHNAIMINNTILINGGIDSNNNYLSDSWLFNTDTQIWSSLDIKGRIPPPLGYHASTLAIEKDRLLDAHSPIYAKPQSFGMSLPDMKEEGLFYFGGMNDNRVPTNMLYKMKVGQKPVEFIIPVIDGAPPSPRISASMDFYSPLNIIVIHGGRNDSLTPSVMNDYILLDLETMNYIHPKFGDDEALERAEHCSFIHGTKLYIFGGVSVNNLMNFDFEVISLDFIQDKINKESNAHFYA